MSNIDLTQFDLEQSTLDAMKAAGGKRPSLAPQPGPDGMPAPDPWPIDEAASHIWQEELQIVEVTPRSDDKNPQRLVLQVQFMVPADSGSENANKRHSDFIRLDPMGPDGYNVMTQISYRKIDALVKATGVAYVEDGSKKSPIRTLTDNCAGQRFVAAIRKRNRPDKRTPGTWFNEDVEVLGAAR